MVKSQVAELRLTLTTGQNYLDLKPESPDEGGMIAVELSTEEV